MSSRRKVKELEDKLRGEVEGEVHVVPTDKLPESFLLGMIKFQYGNKEESEEGFQQMMSSLSEESPADEAE